MERHFDSALNDLKRLLIEMANYVDQSIETAIQGLQARDVSQINGVFEIEKKVNQAHISIDETCVKLLALHQPLAADLRLIVAIIKMNTDLERMGDQAVNIAHNAKIYLQSPALKPLVDLPIMFDEVKVMVRDSIESFTKRDEKLARAVILRDDAVDDLKNKIFKDVSNHLKNQPDRIEQGLALILIARNLERLGDHATNIAEDVIYAVSGDDVRHSGPAEGP